MRAKMIICFFVLAACCPTIAFALSDKTGSWDMADPSAPILRISLSAFMSINTDNNAEMPASYELMYNREHDVYLARGVMMIGDRTWILHGVLDPQSRLYLFGVGRDVYKKIKQQLSRVDRRGIPWYSEQAIREQLGKYDGKIPLHVCSFRAFANERDHHAMSQCESQLPISYGLQGFWDITVWTVPHEYIDKVAALRAPVEKVNCHAVYKAVISRGQDSPDLNACNATRHAADVLVPALFLPHQQHGWTNLTADRRVRAYTERLRDKTGSSVDLSGITSFIAGIDEIDRQSMREVGIQECQLKMVKMLRAPETRQGMMKEQKNPSYFDFD